MKKSGLLKVVLVIVLSLLMVANITSVVFAADDFSGWDDPTAGGSSSTGTTGSTTDGTTATGTGTTDGTTTGTTTTGTTDGTTATTTATTTTTDSSSTSTDTSATDTSSSSSLSTGSATTTLDTNENENQNQNEVNSLAYTGVENTNVLAIVILIGAIVAGYSLRKLREYNNI